MQMNPEINLENAKGDVTGSSNCVVNRERAAMIKERQNPYLGLKKDMIKRLFRQQRKKEENSDFTEVPPLTRDELPDPPAALPESGDELNKSSHETMKEAGPGATSPDTNSMIEPEKSNPLKD